MARSASGAHAGKLSSNSTTVTSESPRWRQLTSIGSSTWRSSATSTAITFPRQARARDDIRLGMRTTITFRKRTIVTYDFDESSGEPVVNNLGVLLGGQDRETAINGDRGDPEADRQGSVRVNCMSAESSAVVRDPSSANAFAQVSSIFPTMTVDSR